MAASDVEIAYVALMRVDSTGVAYTADTKDRTISQNLNFSNETRVIVDPSIPETAGNPTIKAYLKAMASRGTPHLPILINQTMIVTVHKA